MRRSFEEISFDSICFALLILAAAMLLWAGASLTVEHYDGYEYILGAWRLWGANEIWMPKSPGFIALLAVLHAPWKVLGSGPALWHYHLPLTILCLFFAALTGRWVRRFAPKLSWPAATACFCFNRYFFFYVPFAMSDMMVAYAVVLWWYVDTCFDFTSRRGAILRGLALGLVGLGRPQTAIIALVCLALDWWRTRAVRPIVVIAVISVGIYLVVSQSVFLMGGIGRSVPERLTENGRFLIYYFRMISATASAPWRHQLFNMYGMLTPAGVALAVLGGWTLATGRSGLSEPVRQRLTGPMLGSAGFLLFLIWVKTEGPQYLSVFLPAWAVLCAIGLDWIARRTHISAAAAVLMVMFALSMVPAFNHFLTPAYRADIERKTVNRLMAWNPGAQVTYYYRYINFTPLSWPLEKVPLIERSDFMYDAPLREIEFYSDMRPIAAETRWLFDVDRFPIPPFLEMIVREGDTLLIPGVYVRTPTGEVGVTPPCAIRWFKEPRPGARCDPRVKDRCVEVLSLADGAPYRYVRSPDPKTKTIAPLAARTP